MPATAVPPNGDHELISGAKLDTLPRFHADHAGIPCSPLEKQLVLIIEVSGAFLVRFIQPEIVLSI
ncbi:hypothetical protein SNOG_16392 [Parastagonospora nodorum SN15]|uniref:Uncharacterized protein n=1 Tax=Phaeosphaeria nodorum (strain SN15 / ATCC MYA-4574 / FGSC 10173) TaxID=321614 RepID=Q0TVS0_PHANO|nr:hypothetical protein SNOG_16392 [Parastagonospora nodorum SN15]EAT76217.1 hypothetical protein SNOG_16392 [Parastagonospora nodorum SN15]